MKRDMGLVRKILLEIEASNVPPDEWIEISIDGYDRELICYHVAIMGDHGLVEVYDGLSTDDGYRAWPRRMLWEGHDFLDAVRNDTVWNKVKARAGNELASLPFELIKRYGIEALAEYLGR